MMSNWYFYLCVMPMRLNATVTNSKWTPYLNIKQLISSVHHIIWSSWDWYLIWVYFNIRFSPNHRLLHKQCIGCDSDWGSNQKTEIVSRITSCGGVRERSCSVQRETCWCELQRTSIDICQCVKYLIHLNDTFKYMNTFKDVCVRAEVQFKVAFPKERVY